MRKKIFAMVSILTITSFFLFGCGQEDTSNTESVTSEEISDSANGKEAKRVLVSTVMKPLSWADSDGNVQGYEYDVVKEIENMLSDKYIFEIEAVPEEVQDITMEAGEADMAVGGYILNSAREEAYEVPETPIGASAMKLYIRNENKEDIKNLKDAIEKGYKLVPSSPNGGVYKAIVEWNEANGNIIEEIPTQEGLTTAEKLTTVSEGQYDVFINPNIYDNMDVIKEMGLDMMEVEEPIKVDKTVILIKKGETDFCDEINEAMKQLTESGKLEEISNKWYGYNILDYLN